MIILLHDDIIKSFILFLFARKKLFKNCCQSFDLPWCWCDIIVMILWKDRQFFISAIYTSIYLVVYFTCMCPHTPLSLPQSLICFHELNLPYTRLPVTLWNMRYFLRGDTALCTSRQTNAAGSQVDMIEHWLDTLNLFWAYLTLIIMSV